MKNSLSQIYAVTIACICFCALAAAQKPNCTGAVDLFRAKCSMCHAQDGKGYAAIHTPDFTDSKWQAAHKDDELIDAVTNGKQGEGKMPPFKDKLTPEQIDMLVKCAVRGFATKHVENNEKGGK